jgi:DNA-binding XRE family transcriptional regulator
MIGSTVGERLKNFRLSVNMTQKELGKSVFVGKHYVGTIEHERVLPNSNFLINLHKVHKVDINALLCGPI